VDQAVSILNAAKRAFNLALELAPDDKRGGVFCAVSTDTMIPIHLGILIGTVPDEEKRDKYWRLAKEKADRLSSYKAHASSFQSRSPTHDRWGGAVRATYFIFSFSGFPELLDEALVLKTALLAGLMDPGIADTIAKESKNLYFEKMLTIAA
jgi:hypothetical protein